MAAGSSVQRYFNETEFHAEQPLPLHFVLRLKKLIGMGAPPVTESEVMALAGVEAVGSGAMPAGDPLTARDGHPIPRGERDLPIYASAEGGDGVMILDNEAIEYSYRPANLLGVVSAYGVYVVNDSMRPAFEHGDKVHIHPGRPLKPGRDAIFISEQPDGTRHALIKRLVRATDKAWKVEQFNPPKTFDLPKSKWQRAVRVVGIEKAD